MSRRTLRSRAPAHNTRTLSSVVAHEITHNLIRNRLGVLRSVMLPAWVAEGYCDYVAQESNFPESEGLRLLASGRTDPSSSFRFFVDRKIGEHLIDAKGYSFAQLVAHAKDAAAVEAGGADFAQSGGEK